MAMKSGFFNRHRDRSQDPRNRVRVAASLRAKMVVVVGIIISV